VQFRMSAWPETHKQPTGFGPRGTYYPVNAANRTCGYYKK